MNELPNDSRFYLKAVENKCYGYLIVSSDPMGTGKVRLLEFYVYEPYQRFGHGKVKINYFDGLIVSIRQDALS